MDGLSPASLALFLVSTFVGGVTSGLAGFAMGLVVSGVWLHIITPVQTAALIAGYGLLTQGYGIAKLRHEGSSKGLTTASLVDNADELARQVDWLARTYRQPALIEEFIVGREFTVGLIGNDPPEVQPVVQVEIDGELELGRLFYTFEHIRSGAEYVCPAPIEQSLQQRLEALALQTYVAVECRDFGRVDFRVDPKGTAYVLELNPLPSLSTEDVFGHLARVRGISYAAIVNEVLDAALRRYRIVR